MLRTIGLSAACLGLWLATAQADTVELHDGRLIHGQVVPGASSLEIVVETPGGRLTFAPSAVREIRKDSTGLPASKPDSSSIGPPAAVRGDDPSAKDYAATIERAKQITDGKEGATLWDSFLKNNPNGAMADLAKKELAVWKDRQAKDLVRFGANWQPRAEVEKRVALAKDLLAKAEAEQNVTQALALYKQAAEQNPNAIEIPQAKARRLKDGEDRANYGQALGEILVLDPKNVMALNNIGVIAALDKNWSQAILNLAKAAQADNPTAIDNLVHAIYIKQFGEESGQWIVKEDWHDHCRPIACHFPQAKWAEMIHTALATLAAMEHPTLRQVIDKLHQGKKHGDEDYWGAGWVPMSTYAATLAGNKEPIRVIRNQIYTIKAIDARRNTTDMSKKERDSCYEQLLKLHVPGHADKLIMLEESGTPGKSFPMKVGLDLNEYPHDWRGERR